MSPAGEGNGTPLQHSCLENPMDRGAWWAAVHEVARRRTRLSDFTFTFHLRCIGEGNGNPLQCSCLENPRDGGARWAAVYGAAQSRHDWSDLAAAAAMSPALKTSPEVGNQNRIRKRQTCQKPTATGKLTHRVYWNIQTRDRSRDTSLWGFVLAHRTLITFL